MDREKCEKELFSEHYNLYYKEKPNKRPYMTAQLYEIANEISSAKTSAIETRRQYYLLSKYDDVSVNENKSVIRKVQNQGDPIIYLVPEEDIYNRLRSVHINCGHEEELEKFESEINSVQDNNTNNDKVRIENEVELPMIVMSERRVDNVEEINNTCDHIYEDNKEQESVEQPLNNGQFLSVDNENCTDEAEVEIATLQVFNNDMLNSNHVYCIVCQKEITDHADKCKICEMPLHSSCSNSETMCNLCNAEKTITMQQDKCFEGQKCQAKLMVAATKKSESEASSDKIYEDSVSEDEFCAEKESEPEQEILQIDEVLLGFRGKCSIRIYIPNKPDKYGIKIITMCDSKTFYMLSEISYIGKEKRTSIEALPTQYVLKLCEWFAPSYLAEKYSWNL
ncbi:hypothetical protein ILUMI_13365 [Ignelater luminosus]|uniref:PiggyBac transposable element-derived protein domain-containing protein n=1 Tax=Ignelater luminosus TaxID=2038154 RepID=A0A8K0CSJ4_IGNLU|nr:hypothetical protein ILUMI_13365 [Ignelater luminosus]